MAGLVSLVVFSLAYCPYNDLTTPPAAVSSGVNCSTDGDVAEGATCNHVVEGYTCNTVTCASSVWSGTAPCVGDTCSGGPAVASTGVDYTSCNRKTTGEYCDLSCLAGYKKVDGALFILTCIGTKYSDISGVVCLPVCATLSDQGPMHDELSCAGLVEGATCNVRCATGYTGGTALYVCTTGGQEPVLSSGQANPVCNANSCNAVALPVEAANYTSCFSLSTGSVCTPTCVAGYSQSLGGSFPLTCDPNGVFDDSSGIVCLPNPCSLGASNASPNVNYTQCNKLSSGDSCTPSCTSGFITTSPASFSLVCVGNIYTDTSNMACEAADICQAPRNPDPNANYAPCSNVLEGSPCIPTCKPGYERTLTPFTLVCDGGGVYDDPGSCVPVACVGGVVNPAMHVDYTPCTRLRSGSVCEPECMEGYVKEDSTGFTLQCPGGVFTDYSGTLCVVANCSVPRNPHPLADYSTCIGLRTGQSCSPVCTPGYDTVGVAPFDMTCDAKDGSYSDESGLSCVGLPCTKGPSSSAMSASYDTCNDLVSGELCVPSCLKGFTLVSADPFNITCVDGSYADASHVVCEATLCALGASNPTKDVNYTVCMERSTGDVCTPTCRNGFSVPQGVVVRAVELLCDEGAFLDTSGVTCESGLCTAGPVAPSPNVDYSPCSSKRSGETCDPTCLLGFSIDGTSNAFELTCDGLLYEDHADIVCAPEACGNGPTNPNALVNYTTCNSLRSGDTCSPDCNLGYVPFTGNPFVLTCVGGRYTDKSGRTCRPTPCSTPVNPSLNVNYTSCTGLSTGGSCTPLCDKGFTKVSGTGFVVDCGISGSYMDESGVLCEANLCSHGPADPTPLLDYTSCNSKVSGEVCAPTCPDAYDMSTSGSFKLACVERQYEDLSNVTCIPAACNSVKQARSHVNYSTCDAKASGTTCTPTCMHGYRVSSQTTDMVISCTRSDRSYEDTSATVCTEGTCRQGPRTPSPNVVYADCDLLNTGAVCTLSCAEGYDANTFTPFVLLCDDERYIDTSGIVCTPQVCSGGPSNPAPHADYSSCTALRTSETCKPTCAQGTLQSSGAPFVVSCAGGTYIDTSGIACEPFSCANGPSNPGQDIDYTSCNAKRTGDTCIPTCRGGTIPIAGSSFSLVCINDTYSDVSGLMCTTYNGECVQHGEKCAVAGQSCTDPSSAPNDWMCECVAPYSGTPMTMGHATCFLDECTATCATCAGSACPAAQHCVDSDMDVEATADWKCVCLSPAMGSETAAAAVCILDECTQTRSRIMCLSSGQACHDPDLTSTDNWLCRCVDPAIGEAVGAPAGCAYPGECAANSVVCTQAGQTCVDPSELADDWKCDCVLPETGTSRVGAPASCAMDECSPDPCGARQTCIDPNTSIASSNDYICSCPTPVVNSSIGSKATCMEDECIVHAAICSDVGQRCVDENRLTYDDWECRCAGSGVGSAIAGMATCAYSGECETKAHICTSQGQFCQNPNTAVANGWTCNCMDTALGHAVAQAATCELDECTASCPTCANDTCSSASQACIDPKKGSTTLNDWMCACQIPTKGTAVTAVALCEYDECTQHAYLCEAAGQLCEDFNTSITSLNTWQCVCKPPKVGAEFGKLADCRFSGECVANHKTCTDVGQTCVDPSSTTLNDWRCECLPPQSGPNSTASPASCILDECLTNTCGPFQACTDTNTSITSSGDFYCNCTIGEGSAVGGAAVCILDECANVENLMTCINAGQECVDETPVATSTNDWMCRCMHNVSGEAVARAATCAYVGECILQHTTCQPGQTCIDPNISVTGDWSCVGGHFDECSVHLSLCSKSDQGCVDPNPTVSSLDDWECECVLPLTGTALKSVATCGRDECMSSGLLCAQKLQSCVDPDPTEASLDDWQCECIPPAVGSPGIGSHANCALDECAGNTVCSQHGQMCADPVPDPINTGDWQCSCGAHSVGSPATASPAICTPMCTAGEKHGYNVSCPSGQYCREDVVITCDQGYSGSSPSALCATAGGVFLYSGCINPCSQITCADPGPCQEMGACDPVDGCAYRVKFGACDDGSVVTSNDECVNGFCVGEVVCGGLNCQNSDDCHTAACSNDSCVQIPKADGASCNTGGIAGICTGGVCGPADRCGGVVCKAKGQCHEVGVCDAWSGECTEPVVGDGTACDDGDPATSNDRCAAGVCAGDVPCGGAACTAQQCSTPLCANNVCSSRPAADGTPCDDGDILTKNDACESGVCVGVSRCSGVICANPAECMATGICSPVTGQCLYKPLAANTTCDDHQPTTVNDICINGQCNALCKDVVCSEATQCTLAGVCDGHTGRCHANRFIDGTSCDDMNPDTTNDVCRGGVCEGRTLCQFVVCSALNTCREVGTCNATTGRCENPMKQDGSTCDDDDTTTVQDQCAEGFCRGLKVCSNGICRIPPQCREAVCSATGGCEEVDQADGSLCDDGDSATDDSCQGGVCVGCPVCMPMNDCHESATCNVKTGVCIHNIKTDGAACDDSDVQTLNDKCMQGVCVGQQSCGGVLCPMSKDQCLEPMCISNKCDTAPVQDGTPCEDGNYHTINDTCHSGVCAGIAPCANVKCLPVDQCHGPGTCDPATGQCSSPQLSNGVPCDDKSATTRSDHCVDGVCVGTDKCAGLTCIAYSECHQVGHCIPATGVCTAPLMPEGMPCTGGTCRSGTCSRGASCNSVQCKPLSDPCKTYVCTDGACTIESKPNGTTCYDGSTLTMDDKCVSGVCVGLDKCFGVVCTPSSQCMEAGVCDPTTGVCSSLIRQDGEVCNDADSLTVNDKCKSGQCVGHSKCHGVVCVASDGCHGVGACDEATGLCSDPPLQDGVPCDDGMVETVDARCMGGICSGSVMCGGRACTVTDARCGRAACDSSQRCIQVAQPDATPCNDFMSSTVNDQCRTGLCVGQNLCEGVVCTTTEPCHQAGICLAGKCTDSVASFAQPCDDNNAATTSDTCFAGVCRGTPKCSGVICPRESQCKETSTCIPDTGLCDSTNKPDGTQCNDDNPASHYDVCKQGICMGVPTAASIVRVDVGVALAKDKVEEGRVGFLGLLATVLAVSVETFETVIVRKVADSSEVSVFVKVTNTTGEDAAADFKGKVRGDILKETGGELHSGGFPPTTIVTEVMEAREECGVVKVCEENQQICTDPTPYVGYQGDWSCSCKAPLKGSAVLGAATCEDPRQSDVTVNVEVSSSAIAASPSFENETDPLAAWTARVARSLSIDSSNLYATLQGTTPSSHIAVVLAFLGAGPAADRQVFVTSAACCPASCTTPTGKEFCQTLGITKLPLEDISCKELLQPDGCVMKSSCVWNTNTCDEKPPPSSSSSNVLFIVVAAAGGVLLLAGCVAIRCASRGNVEEKTLEGIPEGGPPASPQTGEYEVIRNSGGASSVLAAVGSAAVPQRRAPLPPSDLDSTTDLASEASLAGPATPPAPSFHQNQKPLPIPPMPPVRRPSFSLNPLMAKPLPNVPSQPPTVFQHPELV